MVDSGTGRRADDPPSDDALVARLTSSFAAGGAPVVHDLGLTITAAEPGRVRFDLPVTERVCHAGGVLCGQAIAMAVDTGMVFVMTSLTDGETLAFTTVQLNMTFERGVPADSGHVSFEAWATKTGRSLVFGQIDMSLPDGRRAASATTTYMWL